MWFRANDDKPTIPKKKEKKRDKPNDGKPTIPRRKKKKKRDPANDGKPTIPKKRRKKGTSLTMAGPQYQLCGARYQNLTSSSKIAFQLDDKPRKEKVEVTRTGWFLNCSALKVADP